MVLKIEGCVGCVKGYPLKKWQVSMMWRTSALGMAMPMI